MQDGLGKLATVGLIVAGAVLSWVLAATYYAADPAFLPPGVTPTSVAIASGIAFLASELADLAVYSPLRRRGYVRAALASNIVGTVVDTFLFLWLAGFTIAGVWQGQVVAKLSVTAATVLVVVVVRVLARRFRPATL